MSEETPPNAEPRYPCPECHAGHISIRHIAYYTWVSGELITVPDFPAWVCDMCGLREYDQRSLAWLSILLDPDTGRRPRLRQAPSVPPGRQPLQPEA
jgi:YgiT-type zinc finger domain-containing protein